MPSEVPEDPPICDYEGSDYQTRFWDQGDRAYEDQTEAIALRRLLPPSGELLLEIGAGAGRNTPRYHGYNRIVLLDYSRTQLEQARERLGAGARYLYVAADAYRLPFTPAQFDAVTMIRVLHHMADAPRALEQVRRVLHAGGTFILEFASKRHLKAIFRYLLGRQDWSPFSPEAVEFAPLNFDFHPATVRAWLGDARLAVERQLTVSHFRLDLLKRTVPLKWLVALDSLAQWSGGWWQLTPSVFVRAQARGDDEARPGSAFFQCPACQAPLEGVEPWDSPAPADGEHTCPACHFAWSYRDGIYSFK
jgi:SAM-dependent methyltransferase